MPTTPIFFLWLFLSLSVSVFSQQAEFLYTGFMAGGGGGGGGGGGTFHNDNNSSASIISLNGASVIQDNGILRLTSRETSRAIGRAFYPTTLSFKNSSNGSAFSFSTAFAFAIELEYPKLGGTGFAFTIAPNKELHGALSTQYLGLFSSSNIGNSSNHVFAVEFDTVRDLEVHDINDNHLGIDINNLKSNCATPAAYYDGYSTKHDLSLVSGDTIQAWIDYDGVAKLLNVTISPTSSKPRIPIISYGVDLSPILLDTMFVGFSGSTGLLTSSHYLFGWSFKMNGEAQSLNLSSLPSLPKPKKSLTILILTTSFSGVLMLFIAIIAAALYIYKIKSADVIEAWELKCGPHRYSYEELKHATKGFRDRELLGVGGFGKVYRGILPGTKTPVAVKRVSNDSKQGLREFVAEIATIGRLQHRNLVQLQGWCRRRADLLLVYDFMPNGSLDRFLFDEQPKALLSWNQRFRILRGVASALHYLHEEWEHVVLHRDVKASNVLLDADLNGRLGDFGLAKLYEHGSNPTTTRVVGTLGYLAPELTHTGKATTSSDVFAFGALVLEVVCGRRPIDPKALADKLVLVDWVWERWSQGRWMEVVDPRLEEEYPREEVEVAVEVGLLCSQPSALVRPSMREIVQYLDMDLRKSQVDFTDFVHSPVPT